MINRLYKNIKIVFLISFLQKNDLIKPKRNIKVNNVPVKFNQLFSCEVLDKFEIITSGTFKIKKVKYSIIINKIFLFALIFKRYSLFTPAFQLNKFPREDLKKGKIKVINIIKKPILPNKSKINISLRGYFFLKK